MKDRSGKEIEPESYERMARERRTDKERIDALERRLGFLRPSVRWFAEQMEKKLRKFDGTKPSWLGMDMSGLFHHLEEEVKEVDDELHTIPGSGIRIIEECADVANLAMMIADNHNPLKSENDTGR